VNHSAKLAHVLRKMNEDTNFTIYKLILYFFARKLKGTNRNQARIFSRKFFRL